MSGVEGRADRVYPSTDLRDLMLGVYRDWSEGDDSFVDRVTSDRPEALSPAGGPVYLTGLGDALVRLPR